MRPERRAKQARRASPHAAKGSRPSAALRVRGPERQGLPAQRCPTGSRAGTPRTPGPELPYGFAGRNAKNSRPRAALRVRKPERQGSRPRAALRVCGPERLR
ncbi:hypothetical protein ACTJKB_07290 [Paenibacillus sp. 22594]